MKKDLYENYGDVNPLDYEGLWLRKVNDYEYEYVRVQNTQWYCNDETPTYLLSSGTITTNEDWIDYESITSCYGTEDIEIDSFEYAVAVLNYYGDREFCTNYDEYKTTSRKEARKFINGFGIVIHRCKKTA